MYVVVVPPSRRVHAEIVEAVNDGLLDVQSQCVQRAHRGEQQPGLGRAVDLHPGLAAHLPFHLELQTIN